MNAPVFSSIARALARNAATTSAEIAPGIRLQSPRSTSSRRPSTALRRRCEISSSHLKHLPHDGIFLPLTIFGLIWLWLWLQDLEKAHSNEVMRVSMLWTTATTNACGLLRGAAAVCLLPCSIEITLLNLTVSLAVPIRSPSA